LGNTYSINIEENRFRWFGHVERNPVDSIVRRVDQIEESYYKRYRKTWKNYKKTIMKDLQSNELDLNMVYDRTI